VLTARPLVAAWIREPLPNAPSFPSGCSRPSCALSMGSRLAPRPPLRPVGAHRAPDRARAPKRPRGGALPAHRGGDRHVRLGRRSDWYQNIHINPTIEIVLGRKSFTPTQRDRTPTEAAEGHRRLRASQPSRDTHHPMGDQPARRLALRRLGSQPTATRTGKTARRLLTEIVPRLMASPRARRCRGGHQRVQGRTNFVGIQVSARAPQRTRRSAAPRARRSGVGKSRPSRAQIWVWIRCSSLSPPSFGLVGPQPYASSPPATTLSPGPADNHFRPGHDAGGDTNAPPPPVTVVRPIDVVNPRVTRGHLGGYLRRP
jgi:hypothetical protein